jgi:adenylate cyclase
MRIRFKILAIAYVLLLLFGAAVGISALQHKKTTDELGAIVDYLAPINAAIAEFDIGTFQYELEFRRLARHERPPAGEGERARAAVAEIAGRLRENVAAVDKALQQAVNDPRNNVSDRVILSRIQGSLQAMRAQLAPFVGLGERVLDMLLTGRRAEAVAELHRFEAFEGVFGVELGSIRKDLQNFLSKSLAEAADSERANLRYSVALFAVAAAVGLAFSVWIASHIIGALRRLILGTQAVERGDLGAVLPVTVRDELGQLTEAFNRMIAELRAKEKIKETFGRFVDPRVVSQLIAHADDNPNAAERRTATVFFSDIRGFSGIGEQLTPATLVNLLNRYFTVASAAVRDNRGIVDKYIGDSVMAFWTRPFSPTERDQAVDACKSALAHYRAAMALRAELPDILGIRRNLPKFTLRMGLATGDVVVGTVGSAIAKSYTVIGDTVNLASRLEGINKAYGTRILIDEPTYALAKDAIEAREIDLVVAAGKTEPMRVYQLMAEKGGLDDTQRRVWDLFAQGLAAYRAADWPRAAALFAQCLALDSEDGPSKAFARRVADLAANPPKEWDGVWKAATK